MKTVRVSMDDDVFSKLNRKAKKSGLHSVALLFLHESGVSVSDSAKAVNLVRRLKRTPKNNHSTNAFRSKICFRRVGKDFPRG